MIVTKETIQANRICQSINTLKEMVGEYEHDAPAPTETHLMKLDSDLWHLMYVLEESFEEAIIHIAGNYKRQPTKELREMALRIVAAGITEWVSELPCQRNYLVRFYKDGIEEESKKVAKNTEIEAITWAEGYATAKEYTDWEIS